MSKLKEYLRRKPEIIKNQKAFISIVLDLIDNSERYKQKYLLNAFDAGILISLSESNPLTDEKYNELLDILIHKYCISKEHAEYSIKFWNDLFCDFDFSSVQLPKKEKFPVSDVPGPCITLIKQNYIKKEITIQWKHVDDFSSYEIWRSKNNEEPELLCEKPFPLPKFTDTELLDGNRYRYYLRSLLKSKKYTQNSNSLELFLSEENSRFRINEMRFDKLGLKLTWNLLLGLSSYRVYKKNELEKNWELISELTNKTSFVDDKIETGIFIYYVEAVFKDGSSLKSEEALINLISIG